MFSNNIDIIYYWTVYIAGKDLYVCMHVSIYVRGDQAAQMGSEAQKDKYLPSLSKQQKVCAYVSQTVRRSHRTLANSVSG